MSITFNFIEQEAYVIEHVPLPREDPRLGRLVAHDSRSKAYALPVGAVKSAKHTRKVGIFNQNKQDGGVGSCTTNSGLGLLATGLFFTVPTTNAVRALGLGFDDASALELYKRVTRIDEFRGTYPPDDTGSSGNAVGKLFKQLGLISGWRHALSLDAALTELSERPVITGVPWYSSFDTPSESGHIMRRANARVKGGHEFIVDEVNVEREYVGCTNSWGKNWGLNGHFFMTFKLWEDLLKERGDVTAFVPLESTPEPPNPPEPTPVVDPDAELALAVAKWMKQKGYTT